MGILFIYFFIKLNIWTIYWLYVLFSKTFIYIRLTHILPIFLQSSRLFRFVIAELLLTNDYNLWMRLIKINTQQKLETKLILK